MEDEKIVQLYWDRSELAIEESSRKYGPYCSAIAGNILTSQQDVEECVNDTWLHAWNAMPPHRPEMLSTFLGKITRNLSFDRYKRLHREKRGGHSMELVLDELAECVSGKDDPDGAYLLKELKEEIGRFLQGLSVEQRYQFILRYWYAASIAEIAKRFHKSENQISVSLSRIRKKLRSYLEEKGYSL